MKSQGLPMTTIVLIIIAIVALAVIVIWFFSSSSESRDNTFLFFNISKNKTGTACEEGRDYGTCPEGTHVCCPEGTAHAGQCVPIGNCG